MRLCIGCNEPLAPTKRSHAVYCTRTCKKKHNSIKRRADPVKREIANKRAAKWRADNPEKAKQNVANWQKLNRSRCREIGMRYYTAKVGACPSWLTKEQRDEIDRIYWTSLDLRAVTGEQYHVDHIVPLQGKNVCGLHVPWNLQILPADLNIAKRNHYE